MSMSNSGGERVSIRAPHTGQWLPGYIVDSYTTSWDEVFAVVILDEYGPLQPEHVPFYSNKIRRAAPTIPLEQPTFEEPKSAAMQRLGPPPLIQMVKLKGNELISCKNRLQFWDP